MTNKSDSEKFTHELAKWCGIAFAFWLVYLVVLPHILPLPYIKALIPGLIDNDGGIGTFGDYFGALNTLFAGFAFAGIIISIRQQSADLQATKQEMREQTQQFKLNRAADDIYKRLSLIHELEQSIVFTRYHQKDESKMIGEAALFEICHTLQQLFIVIFPDEDKNDRGLSLNHIQADCISLAISFEYLDAWLKSYRALIEDIRKELKENSADGSNYLRILVNGTHSAKLSVIYAFHDTIMEYNDFAFLIDKGILSKSDILSCTLNKKKRELFIKLLSALLDAYSTPDHCDIIKASGIVRAVANEWRIYKGWQEFLPLISIGSESLDKQTDGYTRSLKSLYEDRTFMEALMKQAQQSSNTTMNSANSVCELTELTFPSTAQYFTPNISTN